MDSSSNRKGIMIRQCTIVVIIMGISSFFLYLSHSKAPNTEKNSIIAAGVKKKAQLVNENGICRMGNPVVSKKELLAELPGFLKIYDTRPRGADGGGTGIFHQFALWCIIRKIAPTHIIETGLNQGMGTWMLRQAAPKAIYTGIDPAPKPPIYTDKGLGTHYLIHKNFRDFLSLDLREEFGIVPATTLAFLDDHQSEVDRVIAAHQNGILHIIVDDNYNPDSTDNYSLKSACNIFTGNYKNGSRMSNFVVDTAMTRKAKYLFNDLFETYFEFPGLWETELTRKNFIFKTKDWKKMLKDHGLQRLPEKYDYANIAYAKLRSFA